MVLNSMIVATCLQFNAGLTGDVQTTISPEEVRALEARRSLRSGHFEYKSQLKSSNPDPRYSKTERHEMWWSANAIRRDTTNLDSGVRDTWCKNCEGFAMIHFIEPDQDRRRLAARTESVANPLAVDMLVDPRNVGMMAESFSNLAQRPLESIVGRKERRNVATSAVLWQGIAAAQVEFDCANGMHASIVIVPEKAHSVVQCETSGVIEGIRYVNRVISEVKQDSTTGLWYPSKCIYARLANGMPEQEETLTVENAELNVVVDSEVFTFKGLKMSKGKTISLVGDKREYLYWDGEQAVTSLNNAAVMTMPANEVVLRRETHYYWALMFAIVGGVGIWIGTRRRRNT